ncbi:zinc finger protein [Trichonephila clavipes]|nr:zinc finger protein [Trichonephila clavipes]
MSVMIGSAHTLSSSTAMYSSDNTIDHSPRRTMAKIGSCAVRNHTHLLGSQSNPAGVVRILLIHRSRADFQLKHTWHVPRVPKDKGKKLKLQQTQHRLASHERNVSVLKGITRSGQF